MLVYLHQMFYWKTMSLSFVRVHWWLLHDICYCRDNNNKIVIMSSKHSNCLEIFSFDVDHDNFGWSINFQLFIAISRKFIYDDFKLKPWQILSLE